MRFQYSLLLLAQAMISICIVSSKALLGEVSSPVILCFRYSIALAILIVLHLIFSDKKIAPLTKLNKKDWFFILAQALCAGAFFNLLFLGGLRFTSASVAGIITSALPAIVALLSITLLKERLTRLRALCLFIAITGLVMINADHFEIHHFQALIGDLMILLSLFPGALYYIVAKTNPNKLPVFLASALLNGINIPVFLVYARINHEALLIPFTTHQWLLLATGGLASGLFYVFWFLGCKAVSGISAGLSTAFMPIVTLILSSLFLQESISLLQYSALALIIGAIILSEWKRGKYDNLRC